MNYYYNYCYTRWQVVLHLEKSELLLGQRPDRARDERALGESAVELRKERFVPGHLLMVIVMMMMVVMMMMTTTSPIRSLDTSSSSALTARRFGR